MDKLYKAFNVITGKTLYFWEHPTPEQIFQETKESYYRSDWHIVRVKVINNV